MRVMAGSNVIAEIPDLNRYEAMTDILQDDGSRNYTDNLGFGATFYNEGNQFLTYTQFQTLFRMSLTKRHLAISVDLKNEKTVYYRPPCPFFNVSNFTIILSDCH